MLYLIIERYKKTTRDSKLFNVSSG